MILDAALISAVTECGAQVTYTTSHEWEPRRKKTGVRASRSWQRARGRLSKLEIDETTEKIAARPDTSLAEQRLSEGTGG